MTRRSPAFAAPRSAARWLRRALAGAMAACCLHAAAADLPLPTALDKAVREHPSVLSKKADLEAAERELQAARWGYYPSVSVQATTSADQARPALVLQQPLFQGGRLEGRVRLAEAGVRQARAALQEVRQGLLQQTGTAYFEVLRLQARTALARRNEQEHQKLVDLIDRRVEASVSPMADRVLARARIQQAVQERIALDRSLQAALLTLGQLAGMQGIVVLEPARLPRLAGSDDALLDQARAQSGELRRLQMLTEVAEAQVTIAQAGQYPSVALVHRRDLDRRGVGSGAPSSQTYVSLEYAPGAGLSASAQVAAARARLQVSLRDTEAYERQLAQQVRNTAAELGALEQQATNSRELVEATGEIVASYLRQYQLGRKNWLDVLNALRESVQAGYTGLDIDHGIESARFRLMIYTGWLAPLGLVHE